MPQSTFEKFLPAAGIAGRHPVRGRRAISRRHRRARRERDRRHDGARDAQPHRSHRDGTVRGDDGVLRGRHPAGLRSGEPRESTYSSAAFAGGIMVAIASALNAWVWASTLSKSVDKDRTPHPRGSWASSASISWLPVHGRRGRAAALDRHRRAAHGRPAEVAGDRHDRAGRVLPCSARRASPSGSRCRSGASRSAWCWCVASRSRWRSPDAGDRRPLSERLPAKPGQVDSIRPGSSGRFRPITIALASTTSARPTHLQRVELLAQHDQPRQGGHGRLEREQDPEDAGGEAAQGEQLQRVRQQRATARRARAP